MEELDQCYADLLRQLQSGARSLPAKDKAAPSERAYRQLAATMSEAFGNIDWLALRNKHSSWKSGRFHSLEEVVDSEDFDAEIERQFSCS